MITPSFAPTATERILPAMALDFTTATLDSRVTVTRALNTATRVNSSGYIETVNADLPRFNYNPTTLICNGLLIEESRTNILLNSLINGTILSTQIVTTSAVAYTLSFYGTGTITLSGSAVAVVTGAGIYPSRKTYTFTPTAGALTCTVTGSVQYAQLEVGSFATSFIPTAGVAVLRNGDAVAMTGTNFSNWYNATQGTFAMTWNTPSSLIDCVPFTTNDGTDNNRIGCDATATGFGRIIVTDTGSTQAFGGTGGMTAGKNTFCVGYKANDFGISKNGGSATTDTSGTVPTVTQLQIGRRLTSLYINGTVAKLNYWKQKVTTAEIQAFSKG